MIISHKHKYIFIHCRKTAGSSISLMLSKSLGPWDIQLSAISETLEAGHRIPRRMWGAAVLNSGLRLPARFLLGRRGTHEFVASAVKRAYRKRFGYPSQHANAETIRTAFPREWESYTKFCVVRNPFTLAVSDYNWRTRHSRDRPSFLEYLRALAAGDELGGMVPVGFHNNWRQYTIDGRVAVDQVIRFETLLDDLGEVLTSLGVPFDGNLPRLKDVKGKGREARSYHHYYTPEARDIVSELYREEIEAFGYRFELSDQ